MTKKIRFEKYDIILFSLLICYLANSSLGSVKILGEGKYFLKRDFPSIYDIKENSLTYICLDEDWKKLMIGKIILE